MLVRALGVVLRAIRLGEFSMGVLALRFLRYGCVVGRGVGGIACDIRG